VLQSYKITEEFDSHVVPLLTRRAFIADGLVFLDDFEQTLLSLTTKGVIDDEVWQWLCESMNRFYDYAVLLKLNEVSDLAYEVAQVFFTSSKGKRKLRTQTLYLVHAALSQIRVLLDPSLDSGKENSLRIMAGIMREL
jgi:hypothetical protein